MASSLSTCHNTMILSHTSQSTKHNHLSSSLFTTHSSLTSLSSDASLRFLRDSPPPPPPRCLGIVAMAPPKAKPGGKAKKVVGMIKLALEAGKATPALRFVRDGEADEEDVEELPALAGEEGSSSGQGAQVLI